MLRKKCSLQVHADTEQYEDLVIGFSTVQSGFDSLKRSNKYNYFKEMIMSVLFAVISLSTITLLQVSSQPYQSGIYTWAAPAKMLGQVPRTIPLLYQLPPTTFSHC